MRRLVSLALVLVLVLVFTSVASAAPMGRAKGHGVRGWAKQLRERLQERFLERARARTGLTDLDEAPWALKHMLRMKAKGLMKGRGGGIMAPNSSVSRLEAIVLAIRVMGLEEEAQEWEVRPEDLPFADAKQMALPQNAWGLPYVALALEKGLLDPQTTLRPQASAAREWVAMLLVKALGLELPDPEEINLEFNDVASISPEFLPYMAAAVAHGLFRGYEDRTLQPHRPIKRAEMAALLDRFDLQAGLDATPEDEETIEGRIVGIDYVNGTITVETDAEQVVPVVITEDTLIFLNAEPALLEDLELGDEVEVHLDAEGQALYVFAEYEAAELKAMLEAVDLEELTITLTVLEIKEGDLPYQVDQQITLMVDEGLEVKVQGETYIFSDDVLRVGDLVEVKFHGTRPIRIVVEEREEAEFTGTVTGIAEEDGTITITLEVEDQDAPVVISVSSEFTVRHGQSEIAASDLQIGDVLEVKLEAGQVVSLVLEERPE